MTRNQVELVTTSSGRSLALHRLTEGDPEKVVVLCHPTPGAGNLIPNASETAKRDVTLISVDRLGYGASETAPTDQWTTITSAAIDLAEILEQITTRPVGVAGWSAGGQVALALAALRPELVDRVVILGTPAPEAEIPWIAEGLKVALGLTDSLTEAAVNQNLQQWLAQIPQNLLGQKLLGVSEADAAITKVAEFADGLEAMLQAAFAQGNQALVNEIAGFNLLPWGFQSKDVVAKTLCLYGSSDPIAAHRHGSWWQKNLPNARLEMVPKAGHLLIFQMWKRVLSHLAPRRKKAKSA